MLEEVILTDVLITLVRASYKYISKSHHQKEAFLNFFPTLKKCRVISLTE